MVCSHTCICNRLWSAVFSLKVSSLFRVICILPLICRVRSSVLQYDLAIRSPRLDCSLPAFHDFTTISRLDVLLQLTTLYSRTQHHSLQPPVLQPSTVSPDLVRTSPVVRAQRVLTRLLSSKYFITPTCVSCFCIKMITIVCRLSMSRCRLNKTLWRSTPAVRV